MNKIKQQFNDMLDLGTIPCFEYTMNNNDHLLVNLQVSDKGIEFSFDSDDKKVFFDGTIEVINDNHYLMPFDEYLNDLNNYLEVINDNIVDGYLVANELY